MANCTVQVTIHTAQVTRKNDDRPTKPKIYSWVTYSQRKQTIFDIDVTQNMADILL
jgi:hypothetical protein